MTDEGHELPAGFLDLYKLAVEMADRISGRRAVANTFFASLHTLLLTAMGAGQFLAVRTGESVSVRAWWGVLFAAGVGAMLCATWYFLLRAYRHLNAAKFEVIQGMEDRLPVRLFREEWERCQRKGYQELGQVERVVPVVFGVAYVIVIALAACRLVHAA